MMGDGWGLFLLGHGLSGARHRYTNHTLLPAPHLSLLFAHLCPTPAPALPLPLHRLCSATCPRAVCCRCTTCPTSGACRC